MPVDLNDKVALVTGGARGIGAAYSRALAEAGARVVVADLDEGGAAKTAESIRAAGGESTSIQLDVASEESATEGVHSIESLLGGIDLLVNNAAIYGGMRVESLLRVDLAYYERLMSVNMHGALVMTRAVFRSMRSRGGGAIVNQSSTAAWMSGGYYSVAKAGLNALTVSLAAELGPMGIRVNGLAPGPIDTEATRSVVPEPYRDAMLDGLALKRMGEPEDLVGLCLFLLSDEARWITGQIFPVDGGQTVRL